MSHHIHHYDSVEDPGPLAAPKLQLVCMVFMALGLASFLYTLFVAHDAERAWAIYLQAMMLSFYVGQSVHIHV